jgi:chromosome partitioning protein
MIIVCGGIKGGSGKTTVATNLAVIRAREGRDVLLIDADEQESSYNFTQVRNESLGDAGYGCIKLTGISVGKETLRLAQKYQDIVIDTGGRDTTSQRAALAIADLALVPFKPRSLDVWTIGRVIQVMQEAAAVNPKIRAVTFLNQADSRGHDNEEAAEILKDSTGAVQFVDIALRHRKAFSNAAAGGLAVPELNPTDPKAVEEVMALYQYIFATKFISETNTKHIAGGQQ